MLLSLIIIIIWLPSQYQKKVKIGNIELNEFLLNRIPNIWSKQAFVQDFDGESIRFKKTVNMFECMLIAESIYEGVVEPSHKKPRRSRLIKNLL